MINVITAPKVLKNSLHDNTLFLAGSIEMGNATNWQNELIFELETSFNSDFNLTIFNPRREDWNSKCGSPEFYQQVTWELMMLEKSDLIFLYFDPDTKSPISLLELGLYTKSKKIIVFCPEKFYRKANVEIVCSFYNIPLFDNYEIAIEYLKKSLSKK